MHQRTHILSLAIGALILSGSPALVRFAAIEGVGPTASAMWRVLLGCLILVVYALLRGRTLLVGARSFTIAAVSGSISAVNLFLWHKAIVSVGVGTATILASTQVFWMALLGALFLGERPARRVLVSAAVGFGGVVLLAGVGSTNSFHSTHTIGIAAGLGTGVAYAASVATLRSAARHAHVSPSDPGAAGHAVLVWVTLFSAPLLAAMASTARESVVPESWAGVLYIVALASLVQVIAWLLISTSAPRVPAVMTALLLIIQPVFASVWGVLCFNESMPTLRLVGGLVTIASVYVGAAGAGKASAPLVRTLRRGLLGGGDKNRVATRAEA